MQSFTWLGAVVCARGLTAGAGPAGNQKPDDPKKDKPFSDAEFVVLAASHGMHEVELGKLAKTNAASSDVRKFGERMVADHTKANEELKAVAAKAGLGLPTMLLSDHRRHIDKFSKLRGAEFDKAYTGHMVHDHHDAVDLFTRATKEAKDPGLKAFAEKTLPTIKEHLELAKKLNESVPPKKPE